MQRLIGWMIVGAALSHGGACWAQGAGPERPAALPAAQTPPASGQTRVTVVNTQPGFPILGIPARIDAPVSPSYAGTAYHTLAGQPETGADAIAAQVMQPDDASPR